MLDAVRHLVDNDIKWRAVPAGFPPRNRVYAFLRRRRDHALVRGIQDQNLTHRHGDLRSLATGDCAREGGPGNQYCDRPHVPCRHGRHVGDRGDPRARFDCGSRSLRTGLRLRPYAPSHPGRCWSLSTRRLRQVHGSRCRLSGRDGLPRFLAAQNRRARGRPASPCPRKVVAQLNQLLDKCLAAGESVFVDSTDAEERVRLDLVARTRRHGRPAVALRFTTRLDVRREHNRLRPFDLRVPDHVLD